MRILYSFPVIFKIKKKYLNSFFPLTSVFLEGLSLFQSKHKSLPVNLIYVHFK